MAGLIPRDRYLANRHSPWGNLNSMLGSFFGEDAAFLKDFKQNFKVDIKNEDDQYVVQADLPGIKKEEVKISFQDNMLTVNVQKEQTKENEENKDKYIHQERSFTSMSRSMYLENVKAEEIKAKLEEGVLTISLPKTQQEQNKKDIQID